MTPEERIKLAKKHIGYLQENLPSHKENQEKIQEIFGGYKEFKKASRIYWRYQLDPRYWNRANMSYETLEKAMSPLSGAYPIVNFEDGVYYYNYRHFLLNEEFSIFK